ncbi:MAG: hypothetical protein EOO39_24970 [Cytophagaceae bacterium]|nr:MAG: hypothetical protein EOO39_24970 [Cytophagaceae bacterium]
MYEALTERIDKAYKQYFPAGVKAVCLLIPVLQIINILFPDGSKRVFAEGTLQDPVCGFDVDLTYMFK